MASDSRLTLTTTNEDEPIVSPQEQQDSQQVHGQPQVQIVQRVTRQVAVGQSDSTYKTFLTAQHIDISTYGDADIQGVPITGYIESFIKEELPQEYEVDDVPQKLLDYFKALPGPPDIGFLVAGYKVEEHKHQPYVWRIIVKTSEIDHLNPDKEAQQGASWGGETDILARLVQPVGIMDNQGNFSQLPYYAIPWEYFTLQDAIDYAIYALRSTIDSIRFQPRAKTVGGPIDVLIIKPDGAFWVQRKELHGETTSS